METVAFGTYYPEAWSRANRGDILTYTSKFPRTLSIGTAVEIHRFVDGSLGEKVATGHVVGINTDVWPSEYEIRVNVTH